MTIQTILSLVLIGILAGLLSGLVGVGGGVIMVPLLILFLGLNQHQAQGTSLAVLAVPVTLLAAYTYHKEGHLDWRYAAVIAVFFVVGGVIGSKIAISLDQKMLKKVFGVILLIIAGKMLLTK
ncbi:MULTISPECIES: sulfite exporter TauE/SafE family protein [Flavobacterium]|uniref:Probable membrane transporter protein n=1 Tax=Flavobacterium jumunjinense TaxID=998845 RepID=A0ABV5GJD8_9FLAO|nr:MULTISPECIES: sulfite exporter TauE/SafE family protein [Flavobacterium]